MTIYQSQVATNQVALIKKVYVWMSIALLITGVTAYIISGSEQIMQAIVNSKFGIWILIGVQLGVVFYLSARIDRISTQTATMLFIIYAILTGVTFSFIFLAFTTASVAMCFFITAGTFILMSIYGFITKRDLTSLGNLFFMGLIGIVIASVVNIFLKSTTLYWVISYAGVFLFVGLIAYDTQKLKALVGVESNAQTQKYAIIGALMLYLDFINLFIFILRIFVRRR